MYKKIFIIVTLLLCLFIGCKKKDIKTKKAIDVLDTTSYYTQQDDAVFRIAGEPEPNTLDPAFMTSKNENKIYSALFEGLVTRSALNNQIEPGLAQKWRENNNGDQWTFLLRSDAVWSDGTPITADDVVFSWLRVLNPSNHSPNADLLCSLIRGASTYHYGTDPSLKNDVKIRALDAHTFQMDLIKPVPYLIDILTKYDFGIVPSHVIQKYGMQWTHPNTFVSNGPFTLDQWQKGYYLSCHKSDTYWDKDTVHLAKVIFSFSQYAQTLYSAYIEGSLDWLSDIPPQFRAKAKEREDYKDTLLFGTYYYKINEYSPFLRNHNIRKALSFAINRDELTSKITNNGEIPSYGIVAPMEGYSVIQNPFQTNLEGINEARQLLSQAGYSSTNPLPPLRLIYQESSINQAIAENIASQLKKKLNVTIIPLSLSETDFQKRIYEKNYDLVATSHMGEYTDPTAMLDLFNTDNFQGYYQNTQYQNLLKKAGNQISSINRLKTLEKAEHILIQEDCSVIPLWTITKIELIDTTKWGGWYQNAMGENPIKDIYLKE